MNETRSYGVLGGMVATAKPLTTTPGILEQTQIIEKGLYDALSRIATLDAKINGPAPQGDGEKDSGSNCVGDNLTRIAGLVNRLHIGLSAIEQRIG